MLFNQRLKSRVSHDMNPKKRATNPYTQHIIVSMSVYMAFGLQQRKYKNKIRN